MEKDVASRPVDVGRLRADRVVPQADGMAQLVQEARRRRRRPCLSGVGGGFIDQGGNGSGEGETSTRRASCREWAPANVGSAGRRTGGADRLVGHDTGGKMTRSGRGPDSTG